MENGRACPQQIGDGFSRGVGARKLLVMEGFRHELAARVSARLPLALRGARVTVARRAAAGLCLVVLIAVGVAVALAVRGRASPAELTAGSSAYPAEDARTGSGSGSASASSARPRVGASVLPTPTTRQIVVDVEGKVHQPGVHSVASTARIHDVLTAAGGALPGVDLTSLDLAERVTDGQQIRVGLAGAPAGLAPAVGAAASSGPSADPADPVDLNEANATQLDALPGIGPALAARIIAWREAHGDFATVQELAQVPGLGGKKLTTLAPLVRV